VAVTVDLDAYFQRIHWSGGRDPTLETLAGLIEAHTAHIPFENLDVLLGRTVRLDLDGLQDKIVSARRGGYCFEHATLFAAVLEAVGFQVSRHAARVVLFGPLAEAKRSHMFMTVAVGGVNYVADPGFGPFAPRFPVPLMDSSAGRTTHWMQREGNFWVLHVTREDRQPVSGWASTLEVENPADFEVFNHYIATHPKSPFVNWIFLSAVTPAGRVNVMNRNVTFLREADEPTAMELGDRAALRRLLAEYFGFDLPEVEHMAVPAIPEWAATSNA
jgi:N-hydroxyarylamine O-acetyltransferase